MSPIKNPHAVALGRRGGLAKSAAKKAAAIENGKKGGRPKRSDQGRAEPTAIRTVTP